jgi:integrase
MLNHLREEIGGTPEQFILFSSSKPRGQTPIRLALDRHIAMAGVPRLTPHGLRHTNDSWLLSTATTIEDVEVIARRNGHSTKQALDTYAHLVNKTQADLIDILGK